MSLSLQIKISIYVTFIGIMLRSSELCYMHQNCVTFIRFIFGGSYFTEIKKRGKDDTIYINQGELGIIHMTDVAAFLEGGQS